MTTEDKIKEAFEEHASKFDTYASEWQDMGAYEAKLREQEPVAWRKLLCFENGANEYKFSSVNVLKDGDPLYLHPAPIPEGYVLVPIEPTKEMISAMQSSGWMPGNYKAMLAAARSE